MQDQMLTTSQVAEKLQVDINTVWGWLKQEGHPILPNAYKLGRDWLIPESDLKDQPVGGYKRGPKAKTKAAKKAAKKGGAK